MGAFRVYVKPFDLEGIYQTDFIEVTSDVVKLGDIKQNLDSTDYDLGIFRLSGLKITLRNDHGRFSEPENNRSIFNFKKKDSQIKITWDVRADPLTVGFFKAGECGPLSNEIEVFRGLLIETTSTSDIESRTIDFDVLGLESLLDRVTVPFSDISDGDDISDVLFEILDQAPITDLLTVSSGNINPGTDQAIDVKASLENKTGKEALGSGEQLLFISQSVLTTENQIVEIKDRTPTAEVQFSFYGPASSLGSQNIIDVKKYREGFNSVVNFWAWDDTSLFASDATSLIKFGVQKKSISADVLTNSTKRQNLLNALRTEFSNPKIELTIVAPLTPNTATLKLLDRVDVDYPTVYLPADGGILPRWGQVKWGDFVWPVGSFELTISQSTKFKVIGRKISVKNETIEFDLREI